MLEKENERKNKHHKRDKEGLFCSKQDVSKEIGKEPIVILRTLYRKHQG